METTEEDNRYRVRESNNDFIYAIEQRSDGIYLVDQTYLGELNEDRKYVFDKALFLPNEMTLGEIINFKYTIRYYENEKIQSSDTIDVSFQLIATGNHEWQGEMYPSITLFVTDNNSGSTKEMIFLKNLGQIEFDGMILDSVKFDEVAALTTFARNDKPAPTTTIKQ